MKSASFVNQFTLQVFVNGLFRISFTEETNAGTSEPIAFMLTREGVVNLHSRLGQGLAAATMVEAREPETVPDGLDPG